MFLSDLSRQTRFMILVACFWYFWNRVYNSFLDQIQNIYTFKKCFNHIAVKRSENQIIAVILSASTIIARLLGFFMYVDLVSF